MSFQEREKTLGQRSEFRLDMNCEMHNEVANIQLEEEILSARRFERYRLNANLRSHQIKNLKGLNAIAVWGSNIKTTLI